MAVLHAALLLLPLRAASASEFGALQLPPMACTAAASESNTRLDSPPEAYGMKAGRLFKPNVSNISASSFLWPGQCGAWGGTVLRVRARMKPEGWWLPFSVRRTSY